MKVAGVLLAAGESSRMGKTKQLLEIDGEPMIRRAARILLGAECQPTVVVLGAHASSIAPALKGLPLAVIENPNWCEGLGASVRVGVEESLRIAPDSDALLITAGDQPGVTEDDLAGIIAMLKSSGKPIVAAQYCSTLGVPAAFAHPMFARLLNLVGERGAKQLIVKSLNEVAAYPLASAMFDLDTPDDLAGFHTRKRGGAVSNGPAPVTVS